MVFKSINGFFPLYLYKMLIPNLSDFLHTLSVILFLEQRIWTPCLKFKTLIWDLRNTSMSMNLVFSDILMRIVSYHINQDEKLSRK